MSWNVPSAWVISLFALTFLFGLIIFSHQTVAVDDCSGQRNGAVTPGCWNFWSTSVCCNGACVQDTSSDKYNCAGCNNQCNDLPDRICSGGACACSAGELACVFPGPSGGRQPEDYTACLTTSCSDCESPSCGDYTKTPQYVCNPDSGLDGTSCSGGGTCYNGSCVPQVCGDGLIEGTEACDLGDASHGNGNGACNAACSTSCTLNVCGVNNGTRYQGPFRDAAQRASGERAVPISRRDRAREPLV